jgi:glycosyltransferase involved in cell wall biosynthesis
VIPVYNPGPFIEQCIDGLRSQTLDPSRFEAIFVDDGSSDETPARLDALAAELPNVHVFHEAASGWSGRPRNVGIDHARGRYVFFNDHDDWLSPEALERMVAYADANEADLCIPKMVGHNRPVPSVLFAEDRPDVTVMTAPLMSGLTPHKLFRREFLNRIGLRFPEGPRRLEDHVFVVEAYLRAARICVFSDYPCYHHIRRPDDGNAGTDRIDPVGYYGNLREVLDVIDRYAEPGPVRDLVRARPYTYEILLRLRRTLTSSKTPVDHKLEVFREARKVVVERYEPEYDKRFPLLNQLRVHAIRQDQPNDLEAIDRLSKRIGLNGQVTAFEVRDGEWIASTHAVVVLEEGASTVHSGRRRQVDRRSSSAARVSRRGPLGVRSDCRHQRSPRHQGPRHGQRAHPSHRVVRPK